MSNGVVTRGKVSITRNPVEFRKAAGGTIENGYRVVGLDLGTNCGIAFIDIPSSGNLQDLTIIMGQWDLSIGPYDAGPLRHVRLKSFLHFLNPSFVAFENVKFVPAKESLSGRNLNAILARVTPTVEFLGGLKSTVTTWAEERSIPTHGFEIAAIKKFATGKGNSNKVKMIEAANEKFGTSFETEGYEKTGVDNIVDAAFVCLMGLDMYAEGLTG